MPGVSATAFDNSGYEPATAKPTHTTPTASLSSPKRFTSQSMPAPIPPLAPQSFSGEIVGGGIAVEDGPLDDGPTAGPIAALVAAPGVAPKPHAMDRAPAATEPRTTNAEATLRDARTAESILETAIATATVMLDRLRATHIRLAGGAELPSAIVAASPPISQSPSPAPARSARPTLADSPPWARHQSEAEHALAIAGMDAATVKHLRRLVREELRERQYRAAADYRSTGLFRYRG